MKTERQRPETRDERAERVARELLSPVPDPHGERAEEAPKVVSMREWLARRGRA